MRIGTHRVDGRFRKRVQQHFGALSSLNGNKNGSVFRKHLGGALMRRDGAAPAQVDRWEKTSDRGEPAHEHRVSKWLRERTWFKCVRVDCGHQRLELESALIALLARLGPGAASEGWLGRSASNSKIPRSSLWNTQRVDGDPMTESQFDTLRRLADGTAPLPANTLGRENPVPEGTPNRDWLVVVPCGATKVWNRHPAAGPTPARDVYVGNLFRAGRAYAEAFANRWVILSAKYGFVAPNFVIPGPYDVSFNTSSPNRVTAEALRQQAGLLALARPTGIAVPGGAAYLERVRDAFGAELTVLDPFPGLPIGKKVQALQRAVRSGEPGLG